MANVYWFGGSGNWSDHTNHWSNNSGNSPASLHGAIPGTDDDVIFDANSGTGTCTINTTAWCKDFNMSASSLSSLVINSGISPYGNFTLLSGMSLTTDSNTRYLSFEATSGTISITTNGVTIPISMRFNGAATFRLVDDLVCSGSFFNRVNGILDPVTNSKKVTLNSSSVAIMGAFTTTSSFYDLTINGYNSNNAYISLNNNITVSNALVIAGYSTDVRLLIKSNTVWTQRTITTTGGSVTVTNTDFQDINAVGDAGDWDLSAVAGGIGDCGNNTGITCTTADEWYWHYDGGNFSDHTKWYTATNGGGTQSTHIPLPQDTAYFDSNSFDSDSQTITMDMLRFGSVVWTGATHSPTFTTVSALNVYGSMTFIDAMSISFNAASLTFYNSTDNTLDSKEKSFAGDIIINKVGGELKLKSNFITPGSLYLNNGDFTAVDGVNNYNVTCGNLISSFATTRVLTMGSGTWTLTGNLNILNNFTPTNLTLNAGTSTIKLTGTLTTDKTFGNAALTGVTWANFWNATTGNYIITVYGSNNYSDFKIDAGRSMKFMDTTDQTCTSLTWIGTSANKITLRGSSTAGWKISDTTGTNDCEWLDIDYSTAEGGATFNATNSTDGGHNSGWNITAPISGSSNFFHFF
jgi:hypothetical protein